MDRRPSVDSRKNERGSESIVPTLTSPESQASLHNAGRACRRRTSPGGLTFRASHYARQRGQRMILYGHPLWQIKMAKRRRGDTAPVGGGSVRAQIERWLKDSGNYTSVQTQPGMVFMIVGRFPKLVPPPGQPMPFFVLQPDDDHSVVAVVTNVTFAQEHRQILTQFSEVERQQFLRELQLGLLFTCEFTFQQD